MAVSDGEHLMVFKELGLVSQVFNEATLSTLHGDLGIGHNRYSTTGSTTWENAQPAFKTDGQRSLALGHNGNLVNTIDLAGRAGRLGAATTDSDLVASILAAHPAEDLGTALLDTLPSLEGAFCFVLMDERSLYAARDPLGLRPLSIGRLPNGFCVASETCALDIVGATFVRDVEPGELVRIDDRGVQSMRFADQRAVRALHLRVRLPRPGRLADPRSDGLRGPARARPAARGGGARRRGPRRPGAGHGALGRAGVRGGRPDPVRRGPDEEPIRRPDVHPAVAVAAGARREAQAQSDAGRGPRQAARGDRRLDRARHDHEADRPGAARGGRRRPSTFGSRRPPIRWPCFYGIDMSTRQELIAADLDDRADPCTTWGRTRSGTSRSRGWWRRRTSRPTRFCRACFDGEYPIPIPEHAGKFLLEHPAKS